VHFAHNAEYLRDYPNLPAWLTRSQIYFTWALIAALGAAGCILYRQGRAIAGLTALFVYAGVGFDGLLHYGRAPIEAHTAAMNATIWIEVVTAALLLVAVLVLGTRQILQRSSAPST
jgi:hypothetical protein